LSDILRMLHRGCFPVSDRSASAWRRPSRPSS
jgi:hypothetical protein